MTPENESNIEGAINAVANLVKEVPVYEDAIQPIAKETGKALQTVGRAVNAALTPVKGLVWGIEKIEAFVNSKVTKKLENTPIENICAPDPAVAGPALESLRYTGHKETLSEMYANLLASAMDINTAKNAHPGFVEIIRNMSADEAKVLEYVLKNQVAPVININRKFKKQGGESIFQELISTLGADAGCEHIELTGSYLINLERLGLIEIPRDGHLTKHDAYDRLLNNPAVVKILESLNVAGQKVKDLEFEGSVKKYYVKATILGKQFGKACIEDREKT